MVFVSHLFSENSKENGCPVEQEPPSIVLLFAILPFCLIDFFPLCSVWAQEKCGLRQSNLDLERPQGSRAVFQLAKSAALFPWVSGGIPFWLLFVVDNARLLFVLFSLPFWSRRGPLFPDRGRAHGQADKRYGDCIPQSIYTVTFPFP